MWECPALVLLPNLPAKLYNSILSTTGCKQASLTEGHTTETLKLREPTVPSILAPEATSLKPTYMFAMCPDNSNHAVQYYLGSYCSLTAVFDLSVAQGPFTLDLGDAFYAPNILAKDKEVRILLGPVGTSELEPVDSTWRCSVYFQRVGQLLGLCSFS